MIERSFTGELFRLSSRTRIFGGDVDPFNVSKCWELFEKEPPPTECYCFYYYSLMVDMVVMPGATLATLASGLS